MQVVLSSAGNLSAETATAQLPSLLELLSASDEIGATKS
jgi:hypothetical protein